MTLDIAKAINETTTEHSNLIIVHGGTGGYKEKRPLPTPVEKLYKYSTDNSIKLKDLFVIFDKAKRGYLTEADFRASLKVNSNLQHTIIVYIIYYPHSILVLH